MNDQAPTPPSFESWQSFVGQWTPLLTRVARYNSDNQDEAMDAYAYMLDRLSENDCRRLRSYSPFEEASFSTWLTSVAKRLCVDHRRCRYGRSRPTVHPEDSSFVIRTQLYHMNASLDLDDLADNRAELAFYALEKDEVLKALVRLLEELTASQRRLLFLRFCEGMSAREIADHLDLCPTGQVYRSVDGVLRGLRSRLIEEGFESSGISEEALSQ
jgi:RNA polymerase sigma factor (sigma-70 family)